MSLVNIKEQYKIGTITKEKYIESMYNLHKILFEYSMYIENTDIKKIEIVDREVYFTSKKAGITCICDSVDKRGLLLEILNFGAYEEEELQMVMSLINDNDLIFDIGANIGWYSMNIAKAFPQSKIFAFEPIPKTFSYLNTNIRKNEFLNILTFNFGLSNENKEVAFFYYPEGSGNSSLVDLSGNSTVQKISCNVKKLDDFTKEKNVRVDFIKCDVEGAELFVFEGGINSIREFKPIIFAEMLRKWAKKMGYHPNDIICLLKNNGYNCFYLKENKLVEILEMTESTVATNFFFLHIEKHHNLIKKNVVGLK